MTAGIWAMVMRTLLPLCMSSARTEEEKPLQCTEPEPVEDRDQEPGKRRRGLFRRGT
ncbi:hypothetical protein [Streptomyces sp. LN590]|uniref:hypothetical protein n=1 Tax=unclassified Streptomyces TaxID=2593676 RepID=UPI0037202950